jgi:hypothetical protein
MSKPELTNEEWDKWTAFIVDSVVTVARDGLGTDHPDYSSVLNAVGDALVVESQRRNGGGGGGRHLHSVN